MKKLSVKEVVSLFNHDWSPGGDYCMKCKLTYGELIKDKVYFVKDSNFSFKSPPLKD